MLTSPCFVFRMGETMPEAVPTGGVGEFVVCALLRAAIRRVILVFSGGTNLLGQI